MVCIVSVIAKIVSVVIPVENVFIGQNLTSFVKSHRVSRFSFFEFGKLRAVWFRTCDFWGFRGEDVNLSHLFGSRILAGSTRKVPLLRKYFSVGYELLSLISLNGGFVRLICLEQGNARRTFSNDFFYSENHNVDIMFIQGSVMTWYWIRRIR